MNISCAIIDDEPLAAGLLEGYVKRIENAKDEDDICFDYEDDWKEEMEGYQAEIAEQVELLRSR